MFRMSVILFFTGCIAIASADPCDLTESNFPVSACSFSNPLSNITVEALKFGRIDEVSESGEAIFLGPNRYEVIPQETIILDAGNTASCNFNESELSDSEIGQDIAFTIDSDDVRKITRLWLLRCENYQPR
ncbi:MAG: hypothetical protein AB8B89_07330 [Gammaproteobacteria bacterium]